MTNFSNSLFLRNSTVQGEKPSVGDQNQGVFCAETELTKVKGIINSGTCLSGMVLHATVLQWKDG